MTEFPSVHSVYQGADPMEEGYPNNVKWKVRGLDMQGNGFSMRNVEFRRDEFGVELPDGSFLVIPENLLPAGLK